ncbi:EscU/YscU/HrcU family type III secretion system export apparatus switch protein [Parvularcula dongshanensis]|uniref:Flagellar biosynthetic protein FlhB n=1 Tax=Parvularcula dongshanensis TaxID=1173995 RepID=A0A840I4E1_9PROT|nr:flagellar biosynthetic protein FlhB [Parvularcula dongshanensis]
MAEGAENDDKAFAPSVERLRKAREKGDVPSSPEVQTLARYAGLLIVLSASGGTLALLCARALGGILARPDAASEFLMTGGTPLAVIGKPALAVIAVLVAPLFLTLVSLIAQQAIVFAPSKIKPDLKRLSPMGNAKKKFGPAGLAEFAKSGIKMLVFAGAGVGFAVTALPRILSRTGGAPGVLPIEIGTLLTGMLLIAVLLSLGAAAIDLPMKHARHTKKLRMTRQEVKDEAKESEGDPEQKRARQRKAQEIAGMAQLAEVPKSDVVIVNPEHYAVALSWDRKGGDVPRCVAKGVDGMALAIRRRAEAAGVPIHRDVSCARALHATVEVGAPIKREHFAAVAAAIRFADRVKAQKKR